MSLYWKVFLGVAIPFGIVIGIVIGIAATLEQGIIVGLLAGVGIGALMGLAGAALTTHKFVNTIRSYIEQQRKIDDAAVADPEAVKEIIQWPANTCPHCQRAAFRMSRKMNLMPFIPVKCHQCGRSVVVPYSWSIVSLLVLLIPGWLGFAFWNVGPQVPIVNLRVGPLLCQLGGIIAMLGFHAFCVPLIGCRDK